MIVPGACFNLFPGVVSGDHPVFDNIDWQPYDSQPLTWSGTSWDYDGDYGGCDDCVRGIKPLGTWAVGFTASTIDITFSSSEAWASYGDLIVFVVGAGGNWLAHQESMPEVIKPAGTHTLSYSVTPNGDLTKVAIWLGRGDGPTTDRSFQITNIEFS